VRLPFPWGGDESGDLSAAVSFEVWVWRVVAECTGSATFKAGLSMEASTRAQLKEARVALSQKDYVSTLKLCSAVLAQHPDCFAALVWVALMLPAAA